MSHAEKQSLEARNMELQRSLQRCAEQKEVLEQQGERSRKALESRWATRPPAGILAPGPRVPCRPGTTSSPASSGGASETAGPSHTDHHPPPLTRPPQVQPSASPPTPGKPTPIPGPHRGGPQHGCPLLAQAVAQVRADTPTPSWAVTPGLQGTRAPLGPAPLGATAGSHPDCGPHKWPGSHPEAASCPLPSVSGSQSRAPGAAGGDRLGAQDGAGVGPGGAGLSTAAEGHPGE